jgi:hypothetical protein
MFDKPIPLCYYIRVSGEQSRQNRIRPDGQAVKTTPSHGVNPGSIPGQVTDGMVVALQQPFFIFMDIDLHLKFNSCMLP